MQIRSTRNMLVAGAHVAAGAVVEVDDHTAANLIALKKAVKATAGDVKRAAKAAREAAAAKDNAADDGLIALIKDNVLMSVHPDQVEALLAEGWLVHEAAADDAGDGAGAGN